MAAETSSERRRVSYATPRGVALATFVGAQIGDGLLTYAGIARFGVDIEANPLVAWYVSQYGLCAGLVGAKAFAVLCALPLFWRDMCLAITVLAGLYLVTAILPWTHLLWP